MIFTVNLDIVSKWLNVPKAKLYETLKYSYQEDTDYIIEKRHRIVKARDDKRGGHLYKVILLTVDCFKRLCMRSRSEKAEQVRTYFIELDDFVTRYTKRILDGLTRKINKVERTPRNDGNGWLYIFTVKGKIKKLGEAKDLIQIIRSYNVGRMDKVKFIATYETKNRKKAEQCVSAFVKDKRVDKRKELYEVDEEIVKRVMQLCANMGDVKLHHNEQWEIQSYKNFYVLFSKEQLIEH